MGIQLPVLLSLAAILISKSHAFQTLSHANRDMASGYVVMELDGLTYEVVPGYTCTEKSPSFFSGQCKMILEVILFSSQAAKLPLKQAFHQLEKQSFGPQFTGIPFQISIKEGDKFGLPRYINGQNVLSKFPLPFSGALPNSGTIELLLLCSEYAAHHNPPEVKGAFVDSIKVNMASAFGRWKQVDSCQTLHHAEEEEGEEDASCPSERFPQVRFEMRFMVNCTSGNYPPTCGDEPSEGGNPQAPPPAGHYNTGGEEGGPSDSLPGGSQSGAQENPGKPVAQKTKSPASPSKDKSVFDDPKVVMAVAIPASLAGVSICAIGVFFCIKRYRQNHELDLAMEPTGVRRREMQSRNPNTQWGSGDRSGLVTVAEEPGYFGPEGDMEPLMG